MRSPVTTRSRVLGTVVAVAGLVLVGTGCPGGDKRPQAPEVDPSTMAAFDAGTFLMGEELVDPADYGDAWFVDQTPQREITLSAFSMDLTEVTVEQFALFLTHAGGELHFSPDQPIERVDGGYLPIVGHEQRPISQVTWQAADHYCRWAGKRLPTEAQWERAATGTEGRTYPWGSDDGPSCARTSYFTEASHCQRGSVDVGSFPNGATPDGVLDLAGNVAEWVADAYDWYPQEVQTDPAGPGDGDLRVVRGGSYLETSKALRSRARRGVSPEARSAAIGFRCAYHDGGVPPSDDEDGAIRGELTAPDDVGRVASDRPLAPPAPVPEILAEGLGNPTDVVRLGGTWYVLDPTAGVIHAAPADGSAASVIFEGLEDPGSMTVVMDALLIVEQTSGEVLQISTAGVSSVEVSGLNSPYLMVTDGSAAFVATDDGVVASYFGEVATLDPVDGITGLATTDSYLYYTAEQTDDHDEEFGRIPYDLSGREVLADGADIYSTYEPRGVAFDADAGAAVFLTRRDSWPSNVEVCVFDEATEDIDCGAHAPPKADHPVVADGGQLVLASQYGLAVFDAIDDATYDDLGGWSDSVGLATDDAGVAWTDRDSGRLYYHRW